MRGKDWEAGSRAEGLDLDPPRALSGVHCRGDRRGWAGEVSVC